MKLPSFDSLATALLAFFLLMATGLGQAPEKEPGPKSKGKMYTWSASNGLEYEYYIPKNYDPEVGANLTLILHGSNLDRRWGFANHKAGHFRPDDIVVSPDGTTSNGKGGFNSLQKKKDLERLHALHLELKELFRVRQTFVYGHSQGSFFSCYYAGAYPEDVDGVVGHASGVWIGTRGGKDHHHQAIVLMHGTADTVVPYRQSKGSLKAHYNKLGYPLARLRTLDGWNHWPHQDHAMQQLAWCEGMTTQDPVRIAASLEDLTEARDWVDPVAVYQVAARAAEWDGMDAKTKKAATAAMQEVSRTAQAHEKAIAKALGKNKQGDVLEDKAWVGHLPLYLLHFRGVPEADAMEAQWRERIEAQSQASKERGKELLSHEGQPKKALEVGIAYVAESYLLSTTADKRFQSQLDDLHEQAKDLKADKRVLKAFKTTVLGFRSAHAKGLKAFAKIGKKYR